MTQLTRLFIFSGLPATGKTTLAQALSRTLKIPYLRIDTVEQALRDTLTPVVQGEGYALGYLLAADNLRQGVSVIADSCNPIALTRTAWQQVALDCGAQFTNIEVVCSDPKVHRHRAEHRHSTIAGLQLPTWQQILDREYDPWDSERIILDTAQNSIDASLQLLWQQL